MPKSQKHAGRSHRGFFYGSSRPQRVRECPGCEGLFYLSNYRSHVRSDCAHMISVPQLRAALNQEANRTGFEVITYTDVAWIIERLVVSRDGPYDLGDAGRSINEGVIDLTDIDEQVDAIASQAQASSAVDAVTSKVADMNL